MIVIPHAQQHIQTTIQCYFPEIRRPRFQIFPLFLLFPWKVPTRLSVPLGWIQKSSPHFLLETQLFCSQYGLEMCVEKGSFHFHAKACSLKWRRLFSSKNASQKSTQCLNFRSKQFLSIQSLPGVQRRKPFQTQLGAGMESNKSYCLQIQPRAQHLMSCSHQAGCVCGTGQEETWPLGWAKVERALQGCSALTCSCCGPGRKAFRKDFSLRCSKGAKLSHNTVILLVSIEFRAAAECCVSLYRHVRGFSRAAVGNGKLAAGTRSPAMDYLASSYLYRRRWTIYDAPNPISDVNLPIFMWSFINFQSIGFIAAVRSGKCKIEIMDWGAAGTTCPETSDKCLTLLTKVVTPGCQLSITHLSSAILSDPLFIHSSNGEECFL